MDLTTATPAEIDAKLAPLATREHEARIEKSMLQRTLADAHDTLRTATASRWDRERAQQHNETLPGKIQKLHETIRRLRVEKLPYVEEWTRRDGWTRAYLVVTNGQGHVHRTTSCGTCYPTTQFAWLTELSGADEQEIVDQAGERACTVCYASAPVSLRLDRPTQLFSDDEKRKQAEREERAAKRAEKDAKRLLHPVTGEVLREVDNGRHGLREGAEIGKTERGAMTAAIRGLNSWLLYGPDHPSAEGWIITADLVAKALVAKNGGEYAEVRADLNARARKSYKREMGREAERTFEEV